MKMLCVTSCNTVIEAGDREEEKESKKLSVPGSFMPSKTKYSWNLKLVGIIIRIRIVRYENFGFIKGNYA